MVEVPTLFVDGENSNYILPEDHELIEEHFPDSEIIEIANAGHWVHRKSQRFFENVNSF